MNKFTIFLVSLLILVVGALGLAWWVFVGERDKNLAASEPVLATAIANKPVDIPQVSVLAKNLEVPWAIAFLPDNKLLFTERPGRLNVIDLAQRNPTPQLVAKIKGVVATGESGLLGVAVHPDFAKNHWVYLYYTYNNYNNKVVRYELLDSQLTNPYTIIDKIPAASTHDGGRIHFGPDGYLYITTGDAQEPDAAQDRKSLAGKILRVRADGKIPLDNPFPNSPVYSYGHRNPQGITWDEKGNLWATEHGAKGHDEITLIQAGKNYGWPIAQGTQVKPGISPPVLESNHDTWAPSGAAILNGKLYFAGLAGRSLYEFDPESKRLIKHFEGDYGRLREAVLGPDNLLYITTSNRDGRWLPQKEDDMIIIINPNKL